ncbi:MAG: LysM peptidoglycan-binding domain-containing protein, partial [Planctomycetes bacterium]|nr:LysM peptidoglycan-binding domain-containing protein [Planctomycetota bacterium]
MAAAEVDMRQFLLGLIVAALAWWGYGKWTSTEVLANQEANRIEAPDVDGDGDVPGGGTSAGGLQDLLAERSGSATGTMPEPREASPATVPTDVAELLARVERGEAAACGTAWLAVASGRLGEAHERVVRALQPRGETFADRLAMLGPHNAFLRSAEGRSAARQTLAAAMALPDAEAIDAGTDLIYLMTCGRIGVEDRMWRAVVDEAVAQHRVRVDRWLCNPSNVAGARVYTVQPGNSLDRIARKFRKEGLKVEAGTIAVLNRIRNPNTLRVGQQLKIPVAPVSALLEKRSYALMVFVGDQLLRLYWVGHGENDRTPVTEFEVIAKQARPDWTAPDGNVYPYGH